MTAVALRMSEDALLRQAGLDPNEADNYGRKFRFTAASSDLLTQPYVAHINKVGRTKENELWLVASIYYVRIGHQRQAAVEGLHYHPKLGWRLLLHQEPPDWDDQHPPTPTDLEQLDESPEITGSLVLL